jgi:hypothetical protein
MNKLSLDVSQSLIFCIVFAVMATLVGLGKIPPEKLEYLLLVLIPSPIKAATTSGETQ